MSGAFHYYIIARAPAPDRLFARRAKDRVLRLCRSASMQRRLSRVHLRSLTAHGARLIIRLHKITQAFHLRLEPLGSSLRAWSSGTTRSTWLTPSVLASWNSVTTVGLRRPRSRSLTYCCVKSGQLGEALLSKAFLFSEPREVAAHKLAHVHLRKLRLYIL